MTANDWQAKIKTLPELCALLGPRPRAAKVALAHGAFDVLHVGHIRHLLWVKSKAPILVASLTSDASMQKGHYKPYVSEALRAMNLAVLSFVDYVLIDLHPTPLQTLGILQPDYMARGYEYMANGLSDKTQTELDMLESYGGEMLYSPGDVVYSSTAITDASPPRIALDKLVALMEAEGLSFGDLRKALGAMANFRVHVIGDTIVDSLTHCVPLGASAKTPTLSLRFERREDFIGGAAIVARHLYAAGAQVQFTTILGADANSKFVLDALGPEMRVDAIVDKTRPTTHKNAIVAGGYRLVKVDTLDNRAISERTLQDLAQSLHTSVSDIVVFADFRHGIFNRQSALTLASAIAPGVMRVADSQVASRWGNILDFAGFDLLTPNEREARHAMGDQDSAIRPLASALYAKAQCKTLILKLGPRGVICQRRAAVGGPRAFFVVDSFAERVVDPVGSGDALLAYAALAQRATGSPVIATILGSVAAALECERSGNIPISKADVEARLAAIERQSEYKP